MLRNGLLLGLFALMGGQLLSNPFKCSEIWFQSQVRSDLSVKATSISLILFAVVKIIAIVKGLHLIGFAYIFLLEAVSVVGIQAIYYLRNYGPIWRWRIQWAKAARFLSNSWPLIVSGLAVMVYMRIDQVMLGAMVGEQAVGEYAAATRISNVWHFIPQILATSLFPAIMSSKVGDPEVYSQRVDRFLDLNVSLAYLITLPLYFIAPFLVVGLFGDAYVNAASILQIHVWSLIFVFVGVARGQLLMAEGLFRFSMCSTLLGAVVNVAGNMILIPRFSAQGAAVATLISQATAAYFSNFLLPSTQGIGLRLTRSLLLLNMPTYIKNEKNTN